ncbi:MAG: thrombospondin type 3 repeat-containing protein, partial [Planctomycetota bacterium]
SEIHAYVPESAPLGSAPVQVVTGGGTSNSMPLNVTSRQAEGRVQWRFQTDREANLQFVTRAPDGTVYTSDLDNLYALGPDGALLWIATGAGGGRPISLGADGTIYTGGSLSEGLNGRIVKAFNPDGTLRWQVESVTGQNLLAGPNVGPDGNIYAVPGGNSEITFGDGQFYASWEVNASGPASVHVFDMDNGNLLWDAGDVGVSAYGYPVLDALCRLLLAHTGSGTVAVTPDGDPDWIAVYPPGTNSLLQPVVGASGTNYGGDWLGVGLWAFDTGGRTLWVGTATDDQLYRLGVAPDESLIVAGGAGVFGEPGWIRGYDTADGAMAWHVGLANENGVIQYPTSWSPAFTPDSQTAYVTTCFFSDVNDYCYLYAIDVPFDPALDTDGDGYSDDVDNCPDVANPDQTESDGDGLGDACETLADFCEEAMVICPGVYAGATVGATTDGSSSCTQFETGNKDVWFSYTPAADGTVTVDTCDGFAGNTLSIHTGCPGTTANQVVCNDYCCQGLTCVTFDAVGGQTYLIRLTGFNDNEIVYTLDLSGPACDADDVDGDGVSNDADNCPDHWNPGQADCDGDGVGDVCAIATGLDDDCDGNGVPDTCDVQSGDCNGNGLVDACDVAGGTSEDCNANGIPDECESDPICNNDLCENAAPLCVGSVDGSTLAAGNEGASWCGFTDDSPDVWYAYSPTSSGTATITTCGSMFDTVLSVHSGCPGTFDNTIACDDDGCNDLVSSLTIPVTAGATYVVRVSGFLGAAGDFTLNLDGPSCGSGSDVPGDADGDGVVGVDDLVLVILGWGPCPGPPVACSGDVDGSGHVDVDDVVMVILNWG